MYSPKISEDLIPMLYRLAKQAGKPMTKYIDDLLRAQVLSAYSKLIETPERSDSHGSKIQDRSDSDQP